MVVFSSVYYDQMNAVKKSITLSKSLDRFVLRRAKARARVRGEQPNFSAALADLIIEARQQQKQPAMKEAA